MNARSIECTRPPLYAKQKAAIFCDERYAVIEASTKSGKTYGCIVWLFERALAKREGETAFEALVLRNVSDEELAAQVKALTS